MPFQERFLALGGERPVHRLTRIRQSQSEQECLGLDPAEDDPQISEIHLGFTARLVGLRDKTLVQGAAGRSGDLRSAPGDVVPHRRIRNVSDVVFVDEPVENPPSSVSLLLRRIQVGPQPPVDRRLERLQLPGHPHWRLPRWRQRAGQGLPDRSAVHMMPLCELTDREILDPGITPDHSEQLHP
jgi:hypothetical protein